MRAWMGTAAITAVLAGCPGTDPGEEDHDAGAAGLDGGADAGRRDGGWDASLGADALDLSTVWPTEDPGDASVSEPVIGDGGPPGVSVDVVCNALDGNAGDHLVTLESGGLFRTAIVHVPAGYDRAKGHMLVLNFHGFGSDALQEQILTRMNGFSDDRGFIVAYPYGVANSWNAGQCCGVAWTDSVDDLAFVSDLITRIKSDWCIDARRVYATGMSNGGFIAHRLACDMPETFAAIAPVAGVLGMPFATCLPPRPVPVIHFHGTGDMLVPYEGGMPILDVGMGELEFPSVEETIAMWREKNSCSPDGGTVVYDQGDARCVRWSGCAQQSEVELCTVEGGGHTWPGGVPIPTLGHTTDDLSATRKMLDFFQRHPLR